MGNVIVAVTLIVIVIIIGYTVSRIEAMVESKDILEAGNEAVEGALDDESDK